MAGVAKSPAPSTTQGGGGNVVQKKRNRKRGGGGGTSGPPQSSNSSNGAKDATGREGGGGSTTATSSAAGRGGGNKGGARRRGGGGGGRGSGGGVGWGGNLPSRYKPSASSPLQLPHVKVTLRNIVDCTKHSNIEGILTSVRKFLEGAFPSSSTAVADGTVESDAYTMAWKLEREEFDAAKSMFAEAVVVNSANGDVGTGGSPASLSKSASREFSHGWVYEEKPTELPSDRTSLLPTSHDIVTNFMSNKTDKRITDSSNINWIVETVMSQMIQQCGKQYLHYVGGRVVLDEESAVEVSLAERVSRERKLLAHKAKTNVDESNTNEASGINVSADEPTNGIYNATSDKKDETSSLAAITTGIEKLRTSDEPNVAKLQQQILNNYSPAIRVRILSVSLVKKSKRRGEIGGKVQLALYPPDPCLLFKEACRDAGRMAAEKYLEKINFAKDQAVASNATAGGNNKEVAKGKDKDDRSKSPLPVKNVEPQIPYFPLLTPSERSRAVARSHVLMNRTIEAMKFHAAKEKKDASHLCWEVLESSSQKTWKGRPCCMLRSLMDGEPLSNLVAEHDSATSAGGIVKSGRGRGGEDARADRYDSTIENSDDYKAYIESLQNGSVPTIEKETEAKKIGDSKPVAATKETPAVDEEGRPLSAIVMHLRAKQAEVDKAKAEAEAARAKARAAAAAAKEKTRKEKLKLKKESSRKRKNDVVRTKKPSSTAPSSRPGGSVGGGSGSGSGGSKRSGSSMPPPGSMLLKKGGVNGATRPS
jgi:hypothetical protein